jgi:spore coat polysaccharide biosynthesis predicted glycosyltransferase SpsG
MTRVGVRCDAGVTSGVGHLVRCVALAEELCSRGVEVLFLGDVTGSGWARSQLRARGLTLRPAPPEPEGLAGEACRLGLDAMVLDSYELPRETGAALRAAGMPVLAIVDGDPLGQDADLYLDQNLGAELRPFPAPDAPDAPEAREAAGAAEELRPVRTVVRRLAGARYALLRDSVRKCRRKGGSGHEVPRVLCFFGGTDSAGVTPAWTRALRDTGHPAEVTVISPVPFTAGGPVTVIPPTDRLPELMAEADLVVTAAGSAIWELLYLGVPGALIRVAANQLIGYDALVGGELAAGLGPVPDAAALAVLSRLLTDPAWREGYGRRARGLVDGRGRERVADALLALTVR